MITRIQDIDLISMSICFSEMHRCETARFRAMLPRSGVNGSGAQLVRRLLAEVQEEGRNVWIDTEQLVTKDPLTGTQRSARVAYVCENSNREP